MECLFILWSCKCYSMTFRDPVDSQGSAGTRHTSAVTPPSYHSLTY